MNTMVFKTTRTHVSELHLMDNIPTLPVTIDSIDAVELPTDPHTTVEQTQNILWHNQLLSLLSQIYNWQSTGQLIRIDLPMENYDNSPLFAIKVSPLWIPLNYFIKLHLARGAGNHYCGCFYTWDRLRSLICPMGTGNLRFSDQFNMPSNLTFIENDTMPDISLHALHSMYWTGSIEYMFKVISNVTTQGKISFSRLYNISRPRVFKSPTRTKTPLIFAQNSQTKRRKNGFLTVDLSRTEDIDLGCLYRRETGFNNIVTQLNLATMGTGGVPQANLPSDNDSYIIADIIGALDRSAGSGSTTIEIWIKAGPDFVLYNESPLSHRHVENVFDMGMDGRPNKIGFSTTNIDILGPDSFKEV